MNGKTEEINKRDFETYLRVSAFNRANPRETRPRDRSLIGKARIKARKVAQRAAKAAA